MKTSFLYRDKKKKWRWKTVIGKRFDSKRITGRSDESFERRASAIKNYDAEVGLTEIPLRDEAGAQKLITTSKGRGY